MPIRFHLDEHVSPAIAEGLRAHGVDVTTSQEAHLLGQDDTDQLSFAISEERVIVTHDRDFSRIHASGMEHFGICYCRPQKHGIGEMVQMLRLVHACFSEDQMRNHLEYL